MSSAALSIDHIESELRRIAPHIDTRILAAERKSRVAVLLPCLNEASAIASVVASVKKSLPDATIYVYDNNSTDGTAEIARAAGAVVRHERLPGKGNVVSRMFADIDARLHAGWVLGRCPACDQGRSLAGSPEQSHPGPTDGSGLPRQRGQR